jgi:hypothetical protein
MKNKFYLLEREAGTCGWDEYAAQIICASSPKEARSLCVAGDEGPGIWLNPKLVTCRVINPTKKTGLIMADGRFS